MSAKPLLRRLRTRAVWWWERWRIPGFRERIWTLPPLPTPTAPGPALVLFATPAALTDAAWAARSLLRQLPTLRLQVALDSAAEADAVRDKWQTLFPGAICHPAASLAAGCRPRLAAFAKANAMGRKLAVVTALQRASTVLYADSDVLAFAPLPEIAAALATESARHIQCVAGTCLDAVMQRRTEALGLPLCPSLNGGFYFVPRGGFDEDRIEQILEGVDPKSPGWFGETVITAALMHALGSEPLPRERFVVSTQRQFVDEVDVDYDRIALRHFVTPVRPLFYRRGLPRLWAQWHSA